MLAPRWPQGSAHAHHTAGSKLASKIAGEIKDEAIDKVKDKVVDSVWNRKKDDKRG